jgi:hypothetical protein
LLKIIFVSGINLQILYVLNRPVGQFEKETPFEEEVHAMNDKMRTGLNLVIALILLWFTVLPADAGQLKYIRVGEYESLTRIVFEFESTVKFKGPEIKSPGQISVDFFDTATDNPALQKIRDKAKHIEKIEFVQKKSVLTANISLTPSSFNLKTWYLFTPDRFVLDIYWTSAPVASVSTVPPVPEKMPEAVSAKPAPENIVQTPVGPAVGIPPETVMPVKETEQQIQQTSSTSSQLQSYLFMGLIGFSIIAIIIVLFVTFIFLKKRRREGPLKSAVLPERVARRMDDLLDEESIVTLDSKIQDELDKYGR